MRKPAISDDHRAPARVNLMAGSAGAARVAARSAGVLGGWPAWLDGVFAPIGATLTPLALFSVGLQFRFRPGQGELGAIGLGLGWKLLVAPMLCWGLGIVAGVGGLVLTVGVLQAAMAPMVSAAILADEYDLEPALANSVLGAGIVLSLLTVPLGNLWLPAG